MKNLHKVKYLVVVLLIVILKQVNFATVPDLLKIGTQKAGINIGEPLVLDLTFQFNKPNISKKTGKVSPVLERRSLVMEIQFENESDIRLLKKLFPYTFHSKNSKGSEYTERVVVFYDWSNQKLVFDKPGKYKISVLNAKKLRSNQIIIDVKSSSIDQQAVTVFSGRDDYAFLMYGLCETEARKEKLKNLASQYKGTLLAKLACARLGIALSEELQKKHPNGEEFMVKYNEGVISEPLVNESYSYLLMAVDISDDFPIKEEVFYHLISLEILKNNYQQAEYYSDEISEKYPKGKYGKKAIQIKKRIQKDIQEKNMNN